MPNLLRPRKISRKKIYLLLQSEVSLPPFPFFFSKCILKSVRSLQDKFHVFFNIISLTSIMANV